MRMVPSFFLTNRIGAPNGDLLGWMKPALTSSSSCFFSSASSVALRRKVGRLGGVRQERVRSCGRPLATAAGRRQLVREHVAERGQRSTSSSDQTIILGPDGLGEVDSTHTMTARECRVDGVQLEVSLSRRICVRFPTWYCMVHRAGERQPRVHTAEQLALGSTFGTPGTAVVVFAGVMVHFRALYLAIQESYGRSDSGFGASW